MIAPLSSQAKNSVRLGLGAQVLALAVAAVVRFQSYPLLFVDGMLLPISNDASYHVRRIVRLAADFHYPGLFDPLFDWPHGAATHWSPGFDAIAAVIAMAFGGRDPHRAMQVAALLPAFYGLVVVFLVGDLATRVVKGGDRFVWATAALFIALLPQSAVISQSGYVDHHVTELLFTALLWRWTLASTELAEKDAPLARRVRFEVMGALLVASAVWVQSVGLLYTGIAAAVLTVLPLVRPISARPLEQPGRMSIWIGSGAPAFGVGAILLLVLYAPAVREHGHAFAYEYPTYFQPMLLALGALSVAAGAWVASVRARGGSFIATIARLGATLVGVVAIAALVFALVPAARSALSGLFSLGLAKGPDLAKIDELRPLFSAAASPDGSRWDRLDGYFGWSGRALFVLLPLALFAARRAGRERFAGIAMWTLAFVGLSLSENRWSRPFVVPVAVVAALGLRFLVERVAERLEQKPNKKKTVSSRLAAAFAAFALGVVLLLGPDPAHALEPDQERDSAVMEAGLYLRQLGRRPEPGAHTGILAPWGDAFQLIYTSELPSLSTGHAWLVGEDGYRLERAAWQKSAASLWALMDARDLGYVVAGADNLSRMNTEKGSSSMFIKDGDRLRIRWEFFNESPLASLMLGGSGLPELGVKNLEHLCPRFVSSEFVGSDIPLPRLWVFERVEGAVLEGKTDPGTRVIAELFLQHAGGIVSYFAFDDAGPDGAYSIRFPVPTGMATKTLASGKVIHIKHGSTEMAQVSLSESQVASGAHVMVSAGMAATPP